MQDFTTLNTAHDIRNASLDWSIALSGHGETLGRIVMHPNGTISGHTLMPLAGSLTKHLLLTEFIHRSANDFAVACAEVHLAGRETTLDRTRDRLVTAVGRLRALASIQRLLQPSMEAMIELGDRLCELCHHHSEARFAEQGAFVFLSANDISIDAQRGWAFLLITSELLTNVSRHAFQRPGGIVHVDVSSRDGEIRCMVHDDGIGMLQHSEKARTGTAIMAELAREAGIQFQVHRSMVGTKIELRTPVNSGL
jgi:two-component sensor histidine kinase